MNNQGCAAEILISSIASAGIFQDYFLLLLLLLLFWEGRWEGEGCEGCISTGC